MNDMTDIKFDTTQHPRNSATGEFAPKQHSAPAGGLDVLAHQAETHLPGVDPAIAQEIMREIEAHFDGDFEGLCFVPAEGQHDTYTEVFAMREDEDAAYVWHTPKVGVQDALAVRSTGRDGTSDTPIAVSLPDVDEGTCTRIGVALQPYFDEGTKPQMFVPADGQQGGYLDAVAYHGDVAAKITIDDEGTLSVYRLGH